MSDKYDQAVIDGELNGYWAGELVERDDRMSQLEQAAREILECLNIPIASADGKINTAALNAWVTRTLHARATLEKLLEVSDGD